jgi:hypothetical protein
MQRDRSERGRRFGRFCLRGGGACLLLPLCFPSHFYQFSYIFMSKFIIFQSMISLILQKFLQIFKKLEIIGSYLSRDNRVYSYPIFQRKPSYAQLRGNNAALKGHLTNGRILKKWMAGRK